MTWRAPRVAGSLLAHRHPPSLDGRKRAPIPTAATAPATATTPASKLAASSSHASMPLSHRAPPPLASALTTSAVTRHAVSTSSLPTHASGAGSKRAAGRGQGAGGARGAGSTAPGPGSTAPGPLVGAEAFTEGHDAAAYALDVCAGDPAAAIAMVCARLQRAVASSDPKDACRWCAALLRHLVDSPALASTVMPAALEHGAITALVGALRPLASPAGAGGRGDRRGSRAGGDAVETQAADVRMAVTTPAILRLQTVALRALASFSLCADAAVAVDARRRAAALDGTKHAVCALCTAVWSTDARDDVRADDPRFPLLQVGLVGRDEPLAPTPITHRPSLSTPHPSPLHPSPYTLHPCPLSLHPSPLSLHR